MAIFCTQIPSIPMLPTLDFQENLPLSMQRLGIWAEAMAGHWQQGKEQKNGLRHSFLFSRRLSNPLGHPFSVIRGSRGTAGQHASQQSSLVSSFPSFYRFSGHSTHKTTVREEW